MSPFARELAAVRILDLARIRKGAARRSWDHRIRVGHRRRNGRTGNTLVTALMTCDVVRRCNSSFFDTNLRT